MGRGRAKAKQVKLARQLKYKSDDADLDRLPAELGVGADSGDGDVNTTLTVLLLSPAVQYSSGVQQPMRATAVLGCHPHTHQAAPFDREQGRAASLHPGGLGHVRARYQGDQRTLTVSHGPPHVQCQHIHPSMSSRKAQGRSSKLATFQLSLDTEAQPGKNEGAPHVWAAPSCAYGRYGWI
jgi:hypothetical protein